MKRVERGRAAAAAAVAAAGRGVWFPVINSHLLTNMPAIVLDVNATSSRKLIVMIALSAFETK